MNYHMSLVWDERRPEYRVSRQLTAEFAWTYLLGVYCEEVVGVEAAWPKL